MHTCKACGKSEPDVHFAKQDGNNRPRSMCNLCRSIIDRAKRMPAESRNYGDDWMNLGIEWRPDWRRL